MIGLFRREYKLSVFRTFLALFSSTTWISFTKLKFRRSFWGAEQVCILIGSNQKLWQKCKKCKKQRNHYTNNKFFFTKLKKTEREIFAFFVITFEPIYVDPVSTSKWPSELQFCEMVRKGRKTAIYQSQVLGTTLYLVDILELLSYVISTMEKVV